MALTKEKTAAKGDRSETQRIAEVRTPHRRVR